MPIKFKPFDQFPKGVDIAFWSYVLADDPTECWPWLGPAHISGYGQFNVEHKVWPAHRVAFYLHYGIDPAPNEVCHICDNRPCCNPFHLFQGTHTENMHDCIKKGRFVLPTPAVGTKHALSKLNDDKVRLIHQLREQGLPYAKIAKTLSISTMVVWGIVNGLAWKHVSH